VDFHAANGRVQNIHTREWREEQRAAEVEERKRLEQEHKAEGERRNAERNERIRKVQEALRRDNRNTEDIANPRKNDIMNLEEMRVNTGGKRNETPLTETQKIEAEMAAREQGFTGEIMQSDNSFTAFHGSVEGERFFYLVIGTDAYPAEQAGNTPNERISMRACMAHEVVGHYRAWERGTTNPSKPLEEAQASIRASKFGIGLSDEEREILFQDAMERLKAAGINYDDVKEQLDIKEV
jgi:hypothetical protein